MSSVKQFGRPFLVFAQFILSGVKCRFPLTQVEKNDNSYQLADIHGYSKYVYPRENALLFSTLAIRQLGKNRLRPLELHRA